MNKNLLLPVLIIVVLAGGAWVYLSQQGKPVNEAVQQGGAAVAKEVVVTLSQQNASGQLGTATLVEENGTVTVTIEATGFTPNVSQPAHIHVGSCPDVGGIAYPLTNVLNGKSVTVLKTTLASLKSELPLGLNLHKSAAEASVYTACGDLVL